MKNLPKKPAVGGKPASDSNARANTAANNGLRLAREPEACPSPSGSNYKIAKKDWMDLFEKRYLSDLLKRHNGNISKAAQEAQVNRKTIHRLLKRHRLTEYQRV